MIHHSRRSGTAGVRTAVEVEAGTGCTAEGFHRRGSLVSVQWTRDQQKNCTDMPLSHSAHHVEGLSLELAALVMGICTYIM